MFQMMGVFAEFERSMIHERVMAGLARARAEGTRLGRPATVADDAAKVRNDPARPALRARASGPLHVSREWVSGRFRDLRDRTQGLGEKTIRLSQPYIAALERANPPRRRPIKTARSFAYLPAKIFTL